MRLIYKDVDISGDISLNYCVHEMYAEKQSDSLTLRFNDPKGTWSKWNPQTGDVLSFEKSTGKTGKMFVHSIKSENGIFTIRAMSMPVSCKDRKSRSWESLRFLHLANTIAESHRLTFKNYGCTDFLYPYIEQNNESDFELFYRVCMLEGFQMLIYDGNLIAYDEQSRESQPPSGELEVGEDGVFAYENNSVKSYGSAEVISGNYSGTFKAPDGNSTQNSRIFRPIIPPQVSNNAEAARFARGMLRNANKHEKRGSFTKSLLLGYAAASTLKLTTAKASMWNGTVFITRVRHDYVGNKSTVYFRKPLEGY